MCAKDWGRLLTTSDVRMKTGEGCRPQQMCAENLGRLPTTGNACGNGEDVSGLQFTNNVYGFTGIMDLWMQDTGRAK